jgi:hypothetical protein
MLNTLKIDSWKTPTSDKSSKENLKALLLNKVENGEDITDALQLTELFKNDVAQKQRFPILDEIGDLISLLYVPATILSFALVVSIIYSLITPHNRCNFGGNTLTTKFCFYVHVKVDQLIENDLKANN